MKKSINIKSFILIAIIGMSAAFSSCVKDEFADPEALVPTFTVPDGATLITIQALKAYHPVLGQLDSITTDLYIKGIVTGNDQFGNIYKTLYIQDETAGIVLSLNKTSLYNEYKQGQLVYVKCKDLVLGDYGGTPQLGGVYNGGTGQMVEIFIANHLFKSGMPGPVPAPIHVRASTDLPDNLSKLVILDSCSFSEPGLPFVSDNLTTDRGLKLKDGTLITVRTSNYASFKNNIIPAGKGTVIGLLGLFNGTYQLAIRNSDDVYGFVPPIADASFTTNPLTWPAPNTWTTQNVLGDQLWGYDASYKMMKVSGHMGSSDFANEDWLISPSYSTMNVPSAVLSFDHAAKFGAPATDLHVMISTDYDGTNFSASTWTELIVPNWPAGSDWLFINSGDIDLNAYLSKPNVRIAFKYTSSASGASTWEVKALNIRR